MKKAIMAFGLATAMLLAAAMARAESMAIGLDTVWAERYIWRGIPLNEDEVLQPSLTLDRAGLALNVWANVDLTDWGARAGYGDETGHATELDYTGSWEGSWFDDKLLLGLGFATYTFPHQREIGATDTTEIFGKIGFGVPLSPSITAYVDENNAEGAAYVSLDLAQNFDLWADGDAAVALNLTGHLGYANNKFCRTYFYDPNLDSRFSDWLLGAALPITVAKGVAITPAYSYTSLMTDELRRIVDRSGLHPEAGIFTLTLSLSAGGEPEKESAAEPNRQSD
jgi:uncharacterized protein (TIGR02001 family)